MDTQPRKTVLIDKLWGKSVLRTIASMAAVVALAAALLSVAAPAAFAGVDKDSPQNTIVVNTLNDLPDLNPADGICQTDANNCSLRAAIQTAQGGALPGSDAIELSLVSGTIFLGSGPLPAITEDLIISGPAVAGTLTLNATGEHQHLIIQPGVTVSISNVDLTRGFGSLGGSIYNQGDLTLTGVTIVNSSSTDDGGAIYGAAGSTTTIQSSSIGDFEQGNGAQYGGAIYNDDGTVNIIGSYVTANNAIHNGGAIYNYRGILNRGILNVDALSVIEYNHAGDYGGGIYNVASGVVNISDSTLTDNSADADGGGIYNYYSTQTLINSTVSGNSAKGSGGGIAEYSIDTAYLYNVTVSDNTADSDGDGTGDGGGISVDGFVNISNSILAGNHDLSTSTAPVHPDCSASSFSNFGTIVYNLVGINAGCETRFINGVNGNQVGTAANPLDPVLGPLGTSGGALVHELLAGSPAIDRGDPTGCKDDLGAVLTQDQRGISRPQNVRCDVGSVEAGWPVVDDQGFTVDEFSPNGTVVGTVFAVDNNDGGPLSYAITGGNGTGSGAFALDPADGELTVADSSQLDYTVNPSFALSVLVTNTIGLTDTAIVTVDVLPDPLVVLNTNDSGTGSLRAAMLYAEGHSGFDTITFSIPGAGPHVIQPTTPLPILNDATTIDGATQPVGEVVIDGSLAGPVTDGFTILNYATQIRHLTIRNFDGSGVAFANTFESPGDGFLNLVEDSTITGNSGDGIVLDPTQYATIRANSIYTNGLLGIDLGADGVTPNDVGDPDDGANGLQNYPVLLRAVPGDGGLEIEGRLNSWASQSFSLEFFASGACDPTGFGEGEHYLGSMSIDTDSAGNARFTHTVPAPPGGKIFITATATDQLGETSEFSQCIVVSPGNDVWPRALRLEPTPEGAILNASASQYLDLLDQSRWYKFHVEPGSRVTVDLQNLPANYDLTLYKDIRKAYDSLTDPQNTGDLTKLNAEFAPDAWTPDEWSPDAWTSDAWSPDAWTPDAWTPDAWTPDAWTPDAWTPDAWTPDAWTPDAWTPDTYSPDAWTPDAWTPDPAYSSAQIRSLIAVSGLDGIANERVVANTWSNSGDYYIRVRGRNGAFSLAAPFTVKLQLETDVCENIDTTLVPTSLTATAGNYHTIILTDLARTPGSPASLALLQTTLADLAGRSEVQGVVVDVGADARVAAANAQGDARPECPPAKNLVADSIKEIIQRYRAVNPLEYVVIVGGDDAIPFFRHPDHSLLANENNYVPPVKNNTASQASLRLGYVLSQDRYGSNTDLSYKSYVIPVPDLAVGRLVETAGDMLTMLDAYLGTPTGVVITPTTSMVSGYDFLTDAAELVANELNTGIGVPPQTLIAPRHALPTDPESWNADQLRALLFGGRHDLIYLAGHFSASTALAADYETRLLSTDVTSSTVSMLNSIVFSAGCHSGYNIVNQAGIPFVTREPDWAQAFARKGATLIAGTGYQYGDTDFIEYSERLYGEFSRQLRLGFGPVPVGKALFAAKLDYLANTPEMRGIHEKALLEATLFGLPMLSVDMPQGRGIPPVDPSIVASTFGFPTNPGASLGLEAADVEITPNLISHTVTLSSSNGAPPVTATYLTGHDGSVTNPGELVFPLEFPNVTFAGMSLRGVGFRGGEYSDSDNIIPLTGAPVTELRGMHPPFQPSIFFPVLPWKANYFDALANPVDGITRLAVLPAQFKVDTPTAVEGTLRSYDKLDFRLFYSDNLNVPGGAKTQLDADYPSLAAPPTISQVTSITSTNQVSFTVTVIGDPVAGVQEVWVVYTGAAGDLYGKWQALDLTQDVEDSKVWKGTLALTTTQPKDVRFFVQAVSGVGLVATVTNMGAYYIAGVDPAATSDNAQATTLALVAPPASGPYATQETFTAQLETTGGLVRSGSAEPLAPLPGQVVKFALGGQQRTAVTGPDGRATAVLPLMTPSGPNQVKVSFAGSADYLPSSASSPFTVVKQATQLSISPQPAQGQYSDVVDVQALLTDSLARPLTQKTVFLVADNGGASQSLPSITNYLGQTVPEPILVPAGVYPLTAYFMGVIPVGGGAMVELEDTLYTSSTRNGTLSMTAEDATVAYTGQTTVPGGQPLLASALVTQADDGSPGDLTKAQVEYIVRDSNNQVVADVIDNADAAGVSSTTINGLADGTFYLTIQVVGGYFSSPVSNPIQIQVGAPTAVSLSQLSASQRPLFDWRLAALLAAAGSVVAGLALRRRTLMRARLARQPDPLPRRN